MTPKEVQLRVERVAAFAENDEAAHVEEDSLFIDVLEAIALGRCEQPVACAREALRTREIGFVRRCA